MRWWWRWFSFIIKPPKLHLSILCNKGRIQNLKIRNLSKRTGVVGPAKWNFCIAYLGSACFETFNNIRHSPFKIGQSYFITCGYFFEQNYSNDFITKWLGAKRNGLVSKWDQSGSCRLRNERVAWLWNCKSSVF